MRMTMRYKEALVERYQKTIHYFGLQYGWIPGMNGDDVESELWYLLFTKMPRYRPKPGVKEKTYVERMFRNKVTDLIRQAYCDKNDWLSGPRFA